MIDINKKYKFRDGKPARILCTDAPGPQPVVAIDGEGCVSTHGADGRFLDGDGECSDYDLIEVVEPKTIWVNEYADGYHLAHDSEEGANRLANANATRVAVKYIEAQ